MNKKLIIFCDGGSRGNPGPAAAAFVVTNDNPSTDEVEVIHKESKYLGIETNNVAEYTAVLLAITWLVKQLRINNEELIIINLDSQLVERQLNGFYKVKNIKLRILYDKIKSQITINKLQIKFNWNYREKNILADELVNETLDLDSTGK